MEEKLKQIEKEIINHVKCYHKDLSVGYLTSLNLDGKLAYCHPNDRVVFKEKIDSARKGK